MKIVSGFSFLNVDLVEVKEIKLGYYFISRILDVFRREIDLVYWERVYVKDKSRI